MTLVSLKGRTDTPPNLAAPARGGDKEVALFVLLPVQRGLCSVLLEPADLSRSTLFSNHTPLISLTTKRLDPWLMGRTQLNIKCLFEGKEPDA